MSGGTFEISQMEWGLLFLYFRDGFGGTDGESISCRKIPARYLARVNNFLMVCIQTYNIVLN